MLLTPRRSREGADSLSAWTRRDAVRTVPPRLRQARRRKQGRVARPPLRARLLVAYGSTR